MHCLAGLLSLRSLLSFRSFFQRSACSEQASYACRASACHRKHLRTQQAITERRPPK